MNIILVTQARFGSSRLPGKVLKEVGGKSLLEIHIDRLKKVNGISEIIVATTLEPESERIVDVAKKMNVSVFKGDMNDVLSRFYLAVCDKKVDIVVRVTSDCPLIDPDVIDLVISCIESEGYDYVSNTMSPTFPDGIDVEAFKFSALEEAYKHAVLPSDREHVTPYIWRNSTFKGERNFTSKNIENDIDYSNFRLTVDENEDYMLISKLINIIGYTSPWMNYIDHLKNNEELFAINSRYSRNEGYVKSLLNDKNGNRAESI